jgi:hypothetical protein
MPSRTTSGRTRAAESASVVVLAVNDRPNVNADAILTQSWWDTGDAIRYFGAIDGEVSPMEAVVGRIARLQRGYTTVTGWKLVIDDFDQQELCSRHEAFRAELVNPTLTMEQLLEENQLTKLSMTTVFRWMGRLGFM